MSRAPRNTAPAVQKWIMDTFAPGSTVTPKDAANRFLKEGGSCSAGLVGAVLRQMVTMGLARHDRRGDYTMLLKCEEAPAPRPKDERLVALGVRFAALRKELDAIEAEVNAATKAVS